MSSIKVNGNEFRLLNVQLTKPAIKVGSEFGRLASQRNSPTLKIRKQIFRQSLQKNRRYEACKKWKYC